MTETATMEREVPTTEQELATSDAKVVAGCQKPWTPETTLDAIFEEHDIGFSTKQAFRAAGLTTLGELADWLKEYHTDADGKPTPTHFIRDIARLSENACTMAIGALASPLLELGVDLADQIKGDADCDISPGTDLGIEALTSLARITELEEECRACESRWTIAKEDASNAKKSFDASVERLRKAIRAANEGPGPLFDKPKPAAGTDTASEPVVDESWKQLPLAEVLHDIPEKKVAVLIEAGFETLGKFVEFQARKGEYPWELKGVGAEWRTKVEDSLMRFWEKWNAEHPAPEVTEPTREESANA